MEQAAAVSVPCVFTTQDPGSQVVVTQVQLPQDQIQASSAVTPFQPSVSVQGPPPLSDVRAHEGVGSIPAVQQAIYQTEGSGSMSGQSLPLQVRFPLWVFISTKSAPYVYITQFVKQHSAFIFRVSSKASYQPVTFQRQQ